MIEYTGLLAIYLLAIEIFVVCIIDNNNYCTDLVKVKKCHKIRICLKIY